MRVLFISSYVPRECGIATYTEDIIHAIEDGHVVSRVLAMEQPDQRFEYGERVIGAINEQDMESYIAAAKRINHSDFAVVALQHEFGIYGGEGSDAAVRFAEAIRKPLVVTFHTITPDPTDEARRNQRALGRRADRVVVMNGLVVDTLESVYDIDRVKVRVMHHGSPVPPCARGACPRELLDLDGRRVLATFGLITPAKGVEYMIQAMPAIVDKYPEALYLVLGQTHPVLRQTEGEAYREGLRRTVRELGVQDHVYFVDRYLAKEEIVRYLLSTDVYVTPYIGMGQVTSGTLAYAVGCGCPVVSTPYLHARYLLADGRGVLVDPCDPRALAAGCLHLFDHPDEHARMAQVNWEFGQSLYWPRVGEEYRTVLREVMR